MARPLKPTAVLELNGAFKKNPNRKRPGEPKETRELGEPPARLPVEVWPFWNELVAMASPGVLKISDRWAVELAARLMWKASSKPNVAAILELVNACEMTAADAKALIASETITSPELSILRSLLSSLGMTPADRSKLSVPTEKKQNKFSSFSAAGAPTSSRPN